MFRAMPERRFPDTWVHQHRVHDAGLLGYTVELTCPTCGRVRGFDPYALWWLFEQRGWDDRLTRVPRRFRCTPCFIALRRVVRPVLRITDAPPTDDTLRRPDLRTWKKSVKRRQT